MCCPSKATHFVVECGQLRFPQLILSPNSNVHSYVRVLGGTLDAFDVSERKSERLSTDEPNLHRCFFENAMATCLLQ